VTSEAGAMAADSDGGGGVADRVRSRCKSEDLGLVIPYCKR
jgi:hypothetical protein